jgi:hypothetical protein
MPRADDEVAHRALADSPCALADGCTTSEDNAHRRALKSEPERRRVQYRWHPFHGQELLVCGERRTASLIVLRCLVVGDERRDCMHIPAWMFDAPTCNLMTLADAPRASLTSLLALRHLVDESCLTAFEK